MDRIFDVKLTKDTTECQFGYTIYFDAINQNSIAINIKTYQPCINVPYGEFIVGKGLRTSIPNTAREIIIFNNCNNKISRVILDKQSTCFKVNVNISKVTECLSLDIVKNLCYVRYINYNGEVETLNIGENDINKSIDICVLGGEAGLLGDSCGFKSHSPKCFCPEYDKTCSCENSQDINNQISHFDVFLTKNLSNETFNIYYDDLLPSNLVRLFNDSNLAQNIKVDKL